MTFNIGNQNAGVINNVAGDQRIEGGQHGMLVSTGEARRAVRDLRAGLASARLDRATAAAARTQLEAIEGAMRAPEPDKPRVAQALRRFTQLIVATGSLVAALVNPVQTLAGWLGALGAPILHALT
jgi:hypothetical protein